MKPPMRDAIFINRLVKLLANWRAPVYLGLLAADE